jgi:hypothetical protein
MMERFQVFVSTDGIAWSQLADERGDDYDALATRARERSARLRRYERIVRIDLDNLVLATFRSGLALQL